MKILRKFGKLLECLGMLTCLVATMWTACSCQEDDRNSTFESLAALHEHLDDDQNGKIDCAESAEFIRDELGVPMQPRHGAFHAKKQEISLEDLSKMWLDNEASKWSMFDVVHWVQDVVQLPELVEVCVSKKIDGKSLPRLATDKLHYFQKELTVANRSHRRKIILHSSDVVLFGPPEGFRMETEVERKERELQYQAIQAVHEHLDDDRSGNIDIKESVEYMRDELESTNTRRHSQFHRNDNEISVQDLWLNWRKSPVVNWTCSDVVKWLVTVVKLPQYEQVFRDKNIDGKKLPSLATEKYQFLMKELGIRNGSHRKKIYLKASEVVLFGPPEAPTNYVKDVLVCLTVLLATMAVVFAFREKNRSRKQIEQMSRDMESLQQAEENLKNIQGVLAETEQLRQTFEEDKLARERQLQEEIDSAKREAERLHLERGVHQEDKIKLQLVEQELYEVRRALGKAETELNRRQGFEAVKELQQWLQMTYKKEAKHFAQRKQSALNQMQEAKDACEKIRKTRRSVFGSMRLAHGVYIDEVDHKILNARNALAEVTNDMQERQYRWKQIEMLCNFSVVSDCLLQQLTPNPSSRRSSIALALAECANLGSMGSLSSAQNETNLMAEAEPERTSLSSGSEKGSSDRDRSFDKGKGFDRDRDQNSVNGIHRPSVLPVVAQRSSLRGAYRSGNNSDSCEQVDKVPDLRRSPLVSRKSTASNHSQYDRASSDPGRAVRENGSHHLTRVSTEPSRLSRFAHDNSVRKAARHGAVDRYQPVGYLSSAGGTSSSADFGSDVDDVERRSVGSDFGDGQSTSSRDGQTRVTRPDARAPSESKAEREVVRSDAVIGGAIYSPESSAFPLSSLLSPRTNFPGAASEFHEGSSLEGAAELEAAGCESVDPAESDCGGDFDGQSHFSDESGTAGPDGAVKKKRKGLRNLFRRRSKDVVAK